MNGPGGSAARRTRRRSAKESRRTATREQFAQYCEQLSDAAAEALAVADGADRLATRVRSPRAVQEDLEEELRRAAIVLPALVAEVAPGAASASWESLSWQHPGLLDQPPPLAIGDYTPTGLAPLRIPLLVPLIGAGAIYVDDNLGPRSPGLALARTIMLRAFAALPPGQFEAVVYDSVRLNLDFQAFREALGDQDLFRLASDTSELRREVRRLVGRARGSRTGARSWALLVCTTAPQLSGDDAMRFRALAQNSAEIGVTVLLPGPPADDQRISFRSDGPEHLADERLRRFRPVDPPDGLVVTVGRQVAAAAEEGLRHTLGSLASGDPWCRSSEKGLAVPMGTENDKPFEFVLNDDTPHALVVGSAGWGKSNLLRLLIWSMVYSYDPDNLRVHLLDFKSGVEFAEFSPLDDRAYGPPHLESLGLESDQRFGETVLYELARNEIERRATAFKEHRVRSLAELREQHPTGVWPRILLVVDEFQGLLAGSSAATNRALNLLENIARKGRSFGIHLLLSSQTVRGIDAFTSNPLKKDAILGQIGLRVAFRTTAEDSRTMVDDDTAATGLNRGAAIVNDAIGHKAANHRLLIPLVPLHSLGEVIERIRNLPAPSTGRQIVHRGGQPADRPHRESINWTVPQTPPRAWFGRRLDVLDEIPVGPLLARAPGRHLAVIAPQPRSLEASTVIENAAAGLASQVHPGACAFELASDDPVLGRRIVEEMRTLLRRAGHRVRVHDSAESACQAPGPCFVVVPLVDATIESRDALRGLVRDGAQAGRHLLGWWRSVPSLREDLGQAVSDLGSWCALGVSSQELGNLGLRYSAAEEVDEDRQWKAAFWDRDQSGAIVPVTVYAGPNGARP